jgi:fructose-1,6-bisphosphatase II
MNTYIPPEIGLALVRATEAAALQAGRYLGLGDRHAAHQAATQAMFDALHKVDIDGHIVIGEEGRLGEHSPLDTSRKVGTGNGPAVDVVADSIDGIELVVKGLPGAMSVVGIAPQGTVWSPRPAIYMDKIVVDHEAADVLVSDCMGAPAGWTLAIIARAKGKEIRDLQVMVLDRPRHENLIEDIRRSGARVLLRPEGDTSGALIATTPGIGADVLMGVGGVPEGVTAAFAVKASRGAMLGRLAPQSDEERAAIKAAGINIGQVLTCDELVSSNSTFFAATGITDGSLLNGVEFHGKRAKTYSLILRGETGIRRMLHTQHFLD